MSCLMSHFLILLSIDLKKLSFQEAIKEKQDGID